MNVCRKLERTLYVCPETEPDNYGLISKDILQSLRFMAMEYSGPTIWGFVRTNSLEEHYFDVYVMDKEMPNGYARFILQKGKCMSPESEDLLDYYCNNERTTINHSFAVLIRNASAAYFPEVNIGFYKGEEKMLLSHLYYSFQRGPREILFKAGLGYLGANLHLIDDVDLSGSSPSRIIHNIPLKFLRSLNNLEGVNLLIQIEDYERFIYFASMISNNTSRLPMINEFQAQYLFEVVECENEFNREIYFYLEQFGSTKTFEEYRNYLAQREVVKWNKYFPLTPTFRYLDSYMRKLNNLCEVAVEGRELYEERFARRKTYLDKKYSYEDGDIFVTAPSFDDFINEALSQNNCLISNYTECHAAGRDSILLFRKASEKDKSYITIELRKNTLVTALGTNNRSISEEEQALVRRYCEAKGIKIFSDRFVAMPQDFYDDIF